MGLLNAKEGPFYFFDRGGLGKFFFFSVRIFL